MRKRDLHGTWMVVAQRFLNDDDNSLENYSIVGAEFQIHKDGDIIWKPHPRSDYFPFMKSEHFRLLRESTPGRQWLLWFHLPVGHNIKFKLKLLEDGQVMELMHPGTIKLQCKRICNVAVDKCSLSFIDALKSSDYSDLTIIAKNGQHFNCHKCILSLLLSDEVLDNYQASLSRNSDVLEVVLCFIYTGCLPLTMTTDRAKKVLKFAKKHQDFDCISTMLQEFLDRTNLRTRAISLVEDVGNRLGSMFSFVEGIIASYEQKRSFFEEPSKCLYVVKELIKQGSLAALKWLLFCDFFTKNKKDLPKQDCDEIFKRISEISISSAHRALELQRTFERAYVGISTDTMSELAVYFLPEVEHVVELITSLKANTIGVIDKMIREEKVNNLGKRKEQKGSLWKIKNMIHVKELMKMKTLFDEANIFFDQWTELSEELRFASPAKRKEKATRNLDKALDVLFCRQDVPKVVVDGGRRKKAKVLLKILISIMARGLEVLRKQKSSLAYAVTTIKQLFPDEQLLQMLQELGFISRQEDASLDSNTVPDPKGSTAENEIPESSVANDDNPSKTESSTCNYLSKSLRHLLETGKYSDMEFHVSSDGNKDEDGAEVVFKAHRVVVATRCEWFNRALHSGMKESIERKFYIEDCSPEVFNLFLQYLYGGAADDYAELSEELLADLLTLADRYETEELMRICELLLAKQLNEKNISLILSFAENIGAQQLKADALAYIKNCTHSIDMDDIEKLSDDLKKQINFILVKKAMSASCGIMPKLEKRPAIYQKISTGESRGVSLATQQQQQPELLSDSGSSNDSTCSEHLFDNQNDISTSSSEGEQSNDLIACVQELRAVLGADTSQNELIQIAIKADFNVNRALNFYFEQ